MKKYATTTTTATTKKRTMSTNIEQNLLLKRVTSACKLKSIAVVAIVVFVVTAVAEWWFWRVCLFICACHSTMHLESLNKSSAYQTSCNSENPKSIERPQNEQIRRRQWVNEIRHTHTHKYEWKGGNNAVWQFVIKFDKFMRDVFVNNKQLNEGVT